MKIGFLVSGNGAALDEAMKIINFMYPEVELFGFTDRICGAFSILQKHCKEIMKFESDNRDLISLKAKDFFSSKCCDFIIVMYSRLISPILFDNINCLNVHPSLLPEFPGFKAVSRAYKKDNKYLGVTLHSINETIDSGPIICQIKTSPLIDSLSYWMSISYLLKIMIVSGYVHSLLDVNNQNKKSTIQFKSFLPEKFELINLCVNPKLLKIFHPIVESSQAYQYVIESQLKK